MFASVEQVRALLSQEKPLILAGEESLLQQTARRVMALAPPGQVVTVGAKAQDFLVARRPECGIMAAGTVLVIDGFQARNGSNTANATSITFEDGKRLFAGSSNQNAPQK